MKLRVGFEMLYDFPQPTPMIMVLGTHFTRASDVIVPDFLTTTPAIEIISVEDRCGAAAGTMIMVATRRKHGNDNPSIISSSVTIS